jgi:hypothetical protein
LDWKYLYFLVSFSVGFLAGYQGLHDRFKRDSWTALLTFQGLIYTLSRGLAPGLIYVFLYATGLISANTVLWALGLGAGSEAFLRTKFYIKEEQKDGGSIDLLKGPFDLLHWYQNLMLEEAATSLTASRKRFIKSNLPQEALFLALCERVMENLQAYPKDQEAIMQAIEGEVRKSIDKFNEAVAAEHEPEKVNKTYCQLLGYKVLNHAGKRGFKTLLSDE